MRLNYYLDTSIWIDLLENRNEIHLNKGELAQKLLDTIINDNDTIILSDLVIEELENNGITWFEFENLINSIKRLLEFDESKLDFIGRAKHISLMRKIPKNDVLHALIARDNNAILITRDKHFQHLTDIIKHKKPEELL